MSLLGRPRRSLLSIKVAKRQARESVPVAIIVKMVGSSVIKYSCRGNAYGYFCAYSAHCVYGNNTWGVAPGYKLLRFQRVLVARHSPSVLKWR